MSDFPIETHEFFNAYRKAFGIVHMKKLFGMAKTSVYRWCADPDTNGETRPNPLDKLESMLDNLVEAGEVETAQRFVDRLARTVGCHITCNDAEPDKDTIQDELLDTWPAVSKMQEAIKEEKPIAIVRDLYRHARRELDEDMTLYESEHE